MKIDILVSIGLEGSYIPAYKAYCLSILMIIFYSFIDGHESLIILFGQCAWDLFSVNETSIPA